LTAITREQSGKRLQLLKAALPKATRIGVLWNPADEFAAREFDFMKTAAPGLGLELRSLEARNPSELEAALWRAERDGIEGVAILASPFIALNLRRIARLALQQRLPTIFWNGEFARSGGFMAYGPAQPAAPVQMAAIVDKILRGAKPSDVPVQQPTRFELVVNKVTAKALGIDVPDVVLKTADEVID
jgi:putative ABC transport system substrate-binding protein